MNAASIAQLAIILAPIAQSLVIDGTKIVAEYKADLSQKQINDALELSRSANWPELTFGLDKGPQQ